MDCFAALAMTSRHNFTPSPHDAPEALMNLSPKEGVGNAGCPLHPRPRVHLVVVERTRVTTSTPESPGIPARNGFTTYFVLSSVTGLVCHRRLRTNVASAPGWTDTTSANLTPASGRQDHTTSPSAATSLVRTLVDHSRAHHPPCDALARKTLPRPPHPCPTFVTIAKRPSAWAGRRNP